MPRTARLIRASQVTACTPATTTAVLHVPAAARPLLRAARHVSCSALGHRLAGRLFAATPFSHERIAAAAANCKIPLPTQRSPQAMWQIRVNCTRVDSSGTRFDASFAGDQDCDPGRSSRYASECAVAAGLAARSGGSACYGAVAAGRRDPAARGFDDLCHRSAQAPVLPATCRCKRAYAGPCGDGAALGQVVVARCGVAG